jgi:hypothetical protein
MSANLGELEAQRILRARESDASRAAQQARDERILCSEQPRFFDAMADHLVDTVKSFNMSMGLEGEDAVTFVHSGSEINVGRKGKPTFLRKIMHLGRSNEVRVRTQVIDGYRNNVNEEKWYFDVQRGELRLNYKNFVECADLLFKSIPDTFR